MPKWNPFFGHLLVVNDIFKARNLPPDIQRPELFRILSEGFDESESLYYVDLWPFISPLLLVSSPNYAIQACQQHELGKPDDLVPFLHPIAGGNSIFTANGEDSKRTRSLFSSGFNSSYVLNQTTHIVQEAEVFVQILRNYAKNGDIIQLDKVTLNYMMDVSGAMTL
jgi:cytochrome P450